MKVLFALFTTLLLTALAGPGAWSQEPAEPVSRSDLEALVRQLNAALEERDAVILELLGRVEALEQQQPGSTVPPAAPPARTELEAATLSSEEELDEVDRLAQSALERALIESGGMLLPKGTFEIQPGLTYSMSAANTVDIDCLLIADILCIGDINSKRLRRESYLLDLTFRAGLPWDMQIDARVPFSQERSVSVYGDGESQSVSDDDLGDIEIALSHQLMREHGWKPSILGELRWKGRTGGDPFDQQDGSLTSGTGFDDLRAGLTFVKVRDPVVLFGNANWTYSFAEDKPEIGEVQPGSGFGIQLGVAVALNLETSLSFGWDQRWFNNMRVNDVPISGTSRRPGTLRIGATYVPSPGKNIDFSVGFGLTDDAPDVEARLSFPWRPQSASADE
jgi:hypothetical protein